MGQKKMVWTREKEGSSNKKALLNQDHESITLFDAHNVQVSHKGAPKPCPADA